MRKEIRISNMNESETFDFTKSIISIELISIQIPYLSSIPTNEWFKYLDGLQLELVSRVRGGTSSEPIAISAYSNLSDLRPIFPIGLILPTDNSAVSTKISLNPKKQLPDEFEIVLVYEENKIKFMDRVISESTKN